MLNPPAPPSAAWYRGDQLLVADAPRAVIQARTTAELDALAGQLATQLQPGCTAVGLLGYEAQQASPDTVLAEIQIFTDDGIRVADAAQMHDQDFSLLADFRSDMSAADYHAAIRRIHDYLRAGDCYQVNFARRFSSRFHGDAFSAWLRLCRQHPAPHSSFFRLSNGDAVFGVSPERFLQIDGRTIVSEPIKGSRPRGKNSEDDRKIGEALQRSSKDLAENLMIVDLLRNDLGRICVAGSVTAAPLFELRRFSNVQHLVSTVAGTLRENISPLQALLSCFPGGSITGAPKKRAMEIIAELEPVPRGFYCGSQFVLDSAGNLDSNILIRTFQTHGDQIICHGGGGIVIDSDAEQEYQESLFKVEKLMAALR